MTTETLIGFVESALDFSEENWPDIERYNATLARLMRRRKSSIEVAGPFIESKTAWKCATLQQAFFCIAQWLWQRDVPMNGTQEMLFVQFWQRELCSKLSQYVVTLLNKFKNTSRHETSSLFII